MRFKFDWERVFLFAKSGTLAPTGTSGVNICSTISRWQNRGSILGGLASGSMIPVAMVYCLLHTDTQKHSTKRKQKDKNTNRDTKIQLHTCHQAELCRRTRNTRKRAQSYQVSWGGDGVWGKTLRTCWSSGWSCPLTPQTHRLLSLSSLPGDPRPFSANRTSDLKCVRMFQRVKKGPWVQVTLSREPGLLLFQQREPCILIWRRKDWWSGPQNVSHVTPTPWTMTSST